MAKVKKRFIDSIGSKLRENIVEETVIERRILTKKKTGFLDMLSGEAHTGGELDEVMPARKSIPVIAKPEKNLLKRKTESVYYSMDVVTEWLEKSRDIAEFHKISIEDVINQALKAYIQKNWTEEMGKDA